MSDTQQFETEQTLEVQVNHETNDTDSIEQDIEAIAQEELGQNETAIEQPQVENQADL